MESLLDYVISPAGPGDAADLANVHVRSWRQTYPGILPQAALSRMSIALKLPTSTQQCTAIMLSNLEATST